MHQLLAKSRFLTILGIIGCFLCATLLMVFGLIETVETGFHTIAGDFSQSGGAKKLLLECIELVDVFLLATVFYIVALGLYELFVDDTIPVPQWLEIHTLDDLKTKLLGVIITVLGVLFLGQVVSWDGERNLLGYGGAIALVISALSFYLRKGKT